MLAAALLLSAAMAYAWDEVRMRAAVAHESAHAGVVVRELQALIEETTRVDDAERLRRINSFFNRRIRFAQDIEVWGVVDYWATPLQTLAKGQGDCEDYAIAKYFSLLASGVPMSSLRLTYVRADMVEGNNLRRSIPHMVLAYYPQRDAEPLILDNLNAQVLPASRRPDLIPVFSFNGTGLWEGIGTVSAGDPVVRLPRWRDLLRRMQEEGFL
jgi:predicted transglutaminase-like cysteine proteinase